MFKGSLYTDLKYSIKLQWVLDLLVKELSFFYQVDEYLIYQLAHKQLGYMVYPTILVPSFPLLVESTFEKIAQ